MSTPCTRLLLLVLTVFSTIATAAAGDLWCSTAAAVVNNIIPVMELHSATAAAGSILNLETNSTAMSTHCTLLLLLLR